MLEQYLPLEWGDASTPEDNPYFNSINLILKQTVAHMHTWTHPHERMQTCMHSNNNENGGNSQNGYSYKLLDNNNNI